jgi:hypothetical protein
MAWTSSVFRRDAPHLKTGLALIKANSTGNQVLIQPDQLREIVVIYNSDVKVLRHWDIEHALFQGFKAVWSKTVPCWLVLKKMIGKFPPFSFFLAGDPRVGLRAVMACCHSCAHYNW